MIAGEASTFIRRPARDILEFTIDARCYRRVDGKIADVVWVNREGDEVVMRLHPKLAGVRLPALTFRARLFPYARLEIESAFGPVLHALGAYRAIFTCEPDREGTVVFHREELRLRFPLSWIVDPLLGGWLQRSTRLEVESLRVLMERD